MGHIAHMSNSSFITLNEYFKNPRPSVTSPFNGITLQHGDLIA